MLIYPLVFGISSGCIALGESARSRRKAVSNLLLLVGLILPALLAGLRALSIGVDVSVYVTYNYDWALQYPDLSEYMAVARSGYSDSSMLFDQFFWLLTWLCARICPDLHFGLFFYNFLLIVSLYLGLKHCCRRSSLKPLVMALGMLSFYILLYNRSLNLMRMMIAVGLLFYAGSFLLEKRYGFAILLWAAAVLFHSSAIVGALFAAMYLFSRRKPSACLWGDLIRIAVLAVGLTLMFLCMTPIILWLVQTGLLRENYLSYLPAISYAEMDLEYSWQMFLWMMCKELFYPDGMLAAFLFLISLGAYVLEYRKTGRTPNENGDRLFLVLCSVAYLIIVLASLNMYYWARLSYYFLPFLTVDHCMLFPKLIEEKGPKTGGITAAGYLLILLAMWYWIYCVQGDCATVPYLFFWQE